MREISGHHSFPKGCMEPGETERETTLREVFEETGLRPRLIEGFRESEEYELSEMLGYSRRVVYFLADYEGRKIARRDGEVADAGMYAFDEATARLTQSAGRILLRADEYLKRSKR